jgi:hypothetical protein
MAELTPVRGIITAPQTEPLSGTGQVSYGVTVGSTGATERWAYAPTINSPNGGIYDVTTAGVWTRSSDLDFSGGAGDFANMPWFQVREGNNRIGGSVWWYSGLPNPTEGSTNITFTMRTHGDAWVPGAGMDSFNNEMRLPDKSGIDDSQYYLAPVLYDVKGRVDDPLELSRLRIEGLWPVWQSSTQIAVQYGFLEIAPPNRALGHIGGGQQLINVSGLSASTWYYFYGYAAPEPNIEIEYSRNAPADVWSGQYAKFKGSGADGAQDGTRRYIFALKTNGSGGFWNVWFDGEMLNQPFVRYLEDVGSAPFLVLNGGTATAETTVSCSAVVPPTARTAKIRVSTNATSAVSLGNSEDNVTLSSTAYIERCPAGDAFELDMPLDANQAFTYRNDAAGGSTTIFVVGYFDRRQVDTRERSAEAAEAQLERFITQRHERRVADEGERGSTGSQPASSPYRASPVPLGYAWDLFGEGDKLRRGWVNKEQMRREGAVFSSLLILRLRRRVAWNSCGFFSSLRP